MLLLPPCLGLLEMGILLKLLLAPLGCCCCVIADSLDCHLADGARIGSRSIIEHSRQTVMRPMSIVEVWVGG